MYSYWLTCCGRSRESGSTRVRLSGLMWTHYRVLLQTDLQRTMSAWWIRLYVTSSSRCFFSDLVVPFSRILSLSIKVLSRLHPRSSITTTLCFYLLVGVVVDRRLSNKTETRPTPYPALIKWCNQCNPSRQIKSLAALLPASFKSYQQCESKVVQKTVKSEFSWMVNNIP